MPENFIDGRWVAAQQGGRREIRCPATGELVAEIDESTAVDTESAIAAARAAFDTGPWAGTSARDGRTEGSQPRGRTRSTESRPLPLDVVTSRSPLSRLVMDRSRP